MFIRKRVRKLKNESNSVAYQAVENYREKGKVKQRIVSLGACPNPKEVLDLDLRYLEILRKQLEIPLSEYKQNKVVCGLYVVVVPMTLKQAEKKRREILEKYEKQRMKVAKLEIVVSKLKIKNT
jgi:hypothetical protein